MGATNRAINVLSVLIIAAAGCKNGELQTSTQIQLDQMERARQQPQTHLCNMVDNAILQDMSLADFHFVGHSNELSGTGVARLDRMAPLLDTYGGAVRYDTSITDTELVQTRLNHVREYLALTGCNMNRVEIKTMLPGGTGMTATRAIEKEQRMHDKKNQPAMGMSDGAGASAMPGG